MVMMRMVLLVIMMMIVVRMMTTQSPSRRLWWWWGWGWCWWWWWWWGWWCWWWWRRRQRPATQGLRCSPPRPVNSGSVYDQNGVDDEDHIKCQWCRWEYLSIAMWRICVKGKCVREPGFGRLERLVLWTLHCNLQKRGGSEGGKLVWMIVRLWR